MSSGGKAASLPDMWDRVFIHAGAHRTGTSSFQQALAENREALARAGYDLAYPGRDGAPEGRLKLQLPRPRHGEKRVPQYAESARRHLEAICPEGREGLVLSEENIPGPMRHFYEGRFFPAAEKRARSLGAAVGRAAHVVFVVRPYAALYASAWRKRAEDNAVPDFADLVPRFLAMDRGWPEIVAALRAGLEPERMTIVEFSSRGRSVDLLRRLVPGLEPGALQEPGQVVNLSATDAALSVLQGRYRAGESLNRPAWKAVLAEHAQDREGRGLTEFPPEAETALAERYARDLERLGQLGGVTLI